MGSYSNLYSIVTYRYVETITELFAISGEFVSQEVSQQLMTLIAEGAGEDEDADADTILRQHSVTIYADLLEKPIAKLPQLLIETMAWVLGEYAYLSADYTLEEILNKLCELVRKGKQLKESTRKIIVTSIMKLVAQAGTCPPQAAKIIDDFSKSKNQDLQQRCIEFQNLITCAPHMLGEVLPVDASCEDIQVDPDLSFMDAYVSQAIANGAKQYENLDDDDDDDDYDLTGSAKASVFKMTPYAKPTAPGASYTSSSMGGVGSNSPHIAGTGGAPPSGSYNHSQHNGITSANTTAPANEPQLNVRNVANVWGKKPANLPTSTPIAPEPGNFSAPVPAPVPSNNWSTTTSSYSTQQTSQPPSESVKTEEQLRKERMAAALFGGSAPSNAPGIARRRAPRTTVAAPVAPTLAPVQAAPTGPATVVLPPTPPAPAPAPVVDLLDFMDDSTPIQTSAALDVDVLAPSPIEPAPVADPIHEEPAVPTKLDDPFAASGLFDGFSDAPLSSLQADSTFEHNGQSLVPLTITTAQFGEKWGSVPHASPISTPSSKCTTLDSFMDVCESVGLYNIEAIPATNEGICGGMVGGTELVLIHGKVSGSGISTKVDVTIKSTDATLGRCLAMYMQNLIR